MPIAGYAGTNHIFPDVFTTSVSRDDMVQGKLMGLLATILAGILVTVENLKAGQPSLGAGTLNHIG